jgi:hypothetical protein
MKICATYRVIAAPEKYGPSGVVTTSKQLSKKDLKRLLAEWGRRRADIKDGDVIEF